MIDKNNPLSNMSYTSKDFSTIYPELMELAKKLSNKWDPTASNESDPGVVLIKENAILGDKLNYNIDKNVLETSPVSVTQIANARHLFEQLGYNCSWYRSATTDIGLTWSGSDSDLDENADSTNVVTDFKFTIPAFTVFTNADGSIPYTIYEDVVIGRYTNDVGSIDPTEVETTAVAKAIQGTPEVYRVHDTDIIKVLNLDDNNRLYFNEKNIAENGIFIWNATDNSDKREYWKLVDNLQLESYGSKVFKFGVTPVDEVCYIEFPDDVTELFDNGVHITYIKTLGAEGNTIAYNISKFMQSTEVEISGIKINGSGDKKDSKDISTLVTVGNSTAALNGSNPESIDDSYDNYLKTVGVFKTLVSLNDYDNYINLYGVEKGLTSKSYTADRTTDIQTSYCILTVRDGIDTLEKQFEQEAGTNKLSPYNLKMFLLRYVPDAYTGLSSAGDNEKTLFNSTFELITSDEKRHAIYPDIRYPEEYKKSLLYDLKHIQHDIIAPEDDSICFIANKYAIKCRIIPNVTLTSQAEADIRAKVRASLLNNLNAKHVDFGKEIDYNYIHSLILNSDSRINTVILDDISYIPHAAVIEENDTTSFKPLLEESNSSTSLTSQGVEITAKSILNGNTPLLDFGGFPFKTNIKNTNQQLIEDIVAIKADYSLALSAGFLKVLDNGIITILQPTTYEAAQYGAGYKFVLNGNGLSLNSESYTALGSDQAVDLYYRPNSNDSYYRLIHYGADSKIIADKSNVNYSDNEKALMAAIRVYFNYNYNTNIPEDNMQTNEIINTFYSGLKSLSNNLSNGQEILLKDRFIAVGDKNVNVNDFLLTLDSSAATLASGETISILADNVVEFKDAKKPVNLSWIIVNNDEDTYTELYTPELKFTKYTSENTPTNTNTYRYILKQGEYLYYTEPNANYVQELTEGFLIEIDVDSSAASESSISFSLTDFSNIPKASEVYMLGPAAIPVWRTINPTGSSIIAKDTSIRINSIRFYEMKADRLYAGDEIKITPSPDIEITSSSEYKHLQSGLEIHCKYSSSDSSSENSIAINNKRSFIKTSCLVNSSAEKVGSLLNYQAQLQNQRLTLYSKSDDRVISTYIDPTSISYNNISIYFNTNLEINNDCSQLTRTVSEDENGNEVKLKLFKFTLGDGINNPYDYSVEYGSFSDPYYVLPIMPNSKYMLMRVGKVTGSVTMSSLDSADRYTNYPAIYRIYDNNALNNAVTLTSDTWYLIDTTAVQTTPLELDIHTGEDSSFVINHVSYCNYSDIITDSIKSALADLDPSLKFKANNIPDEGSLISNPTDGFELFNQSHYLSNYTIPMLDTTSIDIKFVNMSNVRGR